MSYLDSINTNPIKSEENENITPRRFAMNYSTRGTCTALQRNQTNKTTKVTIIAEESGYSPDNIRQCVHIVFKRMLPNCRADSEHGHFSCPLSSHATANHVTKKEKKKTIDTV